MRPTSEHETRKGSHYYTTEHLRRLVYSSERVCPSHVRATDGQPLLVVDDEGNVHNSIHQVYLHPIMVILLMAVLQEVKEKTGTRDYELLLTTLYITFPSDLAHRQPIFQACSDYREYTDVSFPVRLHHE